MDSNVVINYEKSRTKGIFKSQLTKRQIDRFVLGNLKRGGCPDGKSLIGNRNTRLKIFFRHQKINCQYFVLGNCSD